jgi:beta-galactosidase
MRTNEHSWEPTQLRSGEFHYFRVPRRDWSARLEDVRAAGLNAVSIYVPWNWHEPQRGALDLTGETLPERDLVGALDAIDAAGLDCVYRPGPFITAEWRGGGIPAWLWQELPEVQALNAEGGPAGAGRPYPAITYTHPAYEEQVVRWIEASLEPVLARLSSRGGSVINVQLDDESSYWQQLDDPLALDYNPHLLGSADGQSRYARFLLERHGDVATIAATHRQSWSAPGEIEPPRIALRDLSELPRFIDWLDFKLQEVNDHVRFLYDLVRGAGVDVAVSMLHPYLLPLQAAKFGQWAVDQQLDIELTNECYLALFTAGSTPEQKVASVISCHETYRMWHRGLGESVTMELQGSNASYIEPGAMELLYGVTLARGIRGINLFMAVGGENPRGYENLTGREYDLGAPIALDGTRRPNFDTLAKTTATMVATADALAAATPLRDVWVGCYVEYESAALVAGDALFDRSALNAWCSNGDIGLSDAPTMQALLTLSDVSFGCLDLQRASAEELAEARQLWVPALPFMDAATQQRLVDYVRAGGNLVLVGSVPNWALGGESCALLADLAFESARPVFDDLRDRGETYAIVRAEGDEVLVARGTAAALPVAEGGVVLARRDEDDAPCAVLREVGGGTLTVIGFRLAYTPTAGLDQRAFAVRLVERLGGPRHAWSSDAQTMAMQIAGAEGGLVCVVNPVDLPASPAITVTDGEGRRSFPVAGGRFTMNRRGARLLPVDLPLGGGRLLRHATFELVGRESRQGALTLSFSPGDVSQGELAFSGPLDPELLVLTGARLVASTVVGDLHVIEVEPSGEFTLTLPPKEETR